MGSVAAMFQVEYNTYVHSAHTKHYVTFRLNMYTVLYMACNEPATSSNRRAYMYIGRTCKEHERFAIKTLFKRCTKYALNIHGVGRQL